MLSSYSRLSAISVIMAVGLVIAACSNGSSSSNTSRSSTGLSSSNTPISGTSSSASTTAQYSSALATVIGRSTAVAINPAVSAVLGHADITVTAVAPATGKMTLLFPVSGGQVVVPSLVGTVDLTGGLTFSHTRKSVTLINFVINTNKRQLTATVGGKLQPIFHYRLPSSKRASNPHGSVVVSNVELTVTSQAATALNSGLGVGTFRAGMNFGIATLTVVYARGHR